MNADTARFLADKHGWSFGCHAYAKALHDNTSAAPEQIISDMDQQRAWMVQNGLGRGARHFALSPATSSPIAEGPVMSAIRERFETCRVNSGYYETSSGMDPLRLRSVLYLSSLGLSTMQTHIDRTAGLGGALIMTIHDVVASGATATAIDTATLTGILDYAASKNMRFMTRDQLWASPLEQAV